jgi:hypothetical protein
MMFFLMLQLQIFRNMINAELTEPTKSGVMIRHSREGSSTHSHRARDDRRGDVQCWKLIVLSKGSLVIASRPEASTVV